MAGVYKRASDKKRKGAGKWTIWYYDGEHKRRSEPGFTDKARSLELAHRRESEARMVREGMVADPATVAAARASLATHLDGFRAHLVAKGGTTGNADDIRSAARRLLALAGVVSIRSIPFEAVQAAAKGMLDAGRSPRTCNHALGAVKAFVAWLDATGRLDRVPRGFARLALFNEEADRRRVRRHLDAVELARLFAAAEAGVPIKLSRRGYQYQEVWIAGPQRALLYRVAAETGLRANEIRTLAVGSFRLDGAEPAVVIRAAYAKNGREAIQPITLDLASALRRHFLDCDPSNAAFPVPEKTAKLLRKDLAAAAIPYETTEGVVDFHALRASFVTNLINAGASIKAVQSLARHSTPALTLGRYTKIKGTDLRRALEGDS